MPQEYKIQDGESIFDVVLKLYGSLELYGQFIQVNYEALTTNELHTSFQGIFSSGNSIIYSGSDITSYFSQNSTIAISDTGLYDGNYQVLSSSYNSFTGQTFVVLNFNHFPNIPVTFSPAFGPALNPYPSVRIIYDSSLYASEPIEITGSAVIASTSKTIKAQDGQSIYDICDMTYGSIENIYKLIQDNNIDSINETDLAQKKFTYNTDFISDKAIYKYFQSKAIIINTGQQILQQIPSGDLVDGDNDTLVDGDGEVLVDG